jgi:hypothetical protein
VGIRCSRLGSHVGIHVGKYCPEGGCGVSMLPRLLDVVYIAYDQSVRQVDSSGVCLVESACRLTSAAQGSLVSLVMLCFEKGPNLVSV